MTSSEAPAGAGAAQGSPERPFSLVRWFAVLGLVCVALAAVGSASLLTRFLANSMMERDAKVSADFVASIVIAERAWSYFRDRASPEARQGLESFFNHIAELPDVVRANVYATDGTVLWSSTPQLVGQKLGPNAELERAVAGHVEVKNGILGQAAKSEYRTFGLETQGLRFVEAYMPVWNAGGTRVVGVVELYKLPVSLSRTIEEGVRMVWVGALATAVFLYASLFWIVRRADRLMRAQRERLVEAETLATVGAFASAVAHGLRNPLAIMRSSAELAREEEEETVRREVLTDILREADRLDGWVRDLLLSARGEATASGAVDVNALLQESAQSFAAAAEQQHIRLSLRARAVPLARGESGPLARAIDNIVGNAIEAMPQGGELVIETAPVRAGGVVEIRIADSGQGMSPELARRVARPFCSTKPRGTGLGLALARRIVASYAGSLTLETSEGRGTTVTIRLQAAG